LGTQGADGRLAVIAQQFHGLVQELVFVFRPRDGVVPPQPGQDLIFGFGAQVVVPVG